jgi:hypothetical protein
VLRNEAFADRSDVHGDTDVDGHNSPGCGNASQGGIPQNPVRREYDAPPCIQRAAALWRKPLRAERFQRQM